MAEKALKCSKCGIAPSPFLEAKPGGTHYRIVEHGVGIPGRKPTRIARKCGTWVEKKPEPPGKVDSQGFPIPCPGEVMDKELASLDRRTLPPDDES